MKLLVGIVTLALVALGATTVITFKDNSRLEAAHARMRDTAESLNARSKDLGQMLREQQAEATEDMERVERRFRKRLEGRQKCSGPHPGHVWLFPESGPVGTRVRIVGDCFVSDYYDNTRELTGGYGIFLIRQLGDLHPLGECEHIVGGSPFDIEMTKGRVEGYFTVGSDGWCFQHQEGPFPTAATSYQLGIGCHACSTNARFTVTP